MAYLRTLLTTKELGKGTGLGLSNVYGIVKQSAGTIQVRSQPGQGTTFEVLLPAAKTEPSREVEQAASPAGLSGSETILVAEDETGVKMFIREILRSHGYRVLEAANGREALSRAETYSGDIDLLLTDVMMPEMGGLELAQGFAELRPGVAVVHMSGYTDRALPPEVMKALLHKPFTPAVLLGRVRQSLPARERGRSVADLPEPDQ